MLLQPASVRESIAEERARWAKVRERTWPGGRVSLIRGKCELPNHVPSVITSVWQLWLRVVQLGGGVSILRHVQLRGGCGALMQKSAGP